MDHYQSNGWKGDTDSLKYVLCPKVNSRQGWIRSKDTTLMKSITSTTSLNSPTTPLKRGMV